MKIENKEQYNQSKSAMFLFKLMDILSFALMGVGSVPNFSVLPLEKGNWNSCCYYSHS